MNPITLFISMISFTFLAHAYESPRATISQAAYKIATKRAGAHRKTDDEIINDLYSPFDYAKVGRVVGRDYFLCCKRYGDGASAPVYCHYCN